MRIVGTPSSWAELTATTPSSTAFSSAVAERGKLVYRRERPSCWRVLLPASWDEYLSRLSKSHRKQIRRLQRNYFDTGRARACVAQTPDELQRGLDFLIRLHQRRRESLGQRGSFASESFARFHRQTAPRLLAAGRLRLAWLEVDGRTVAAEYQVLGNDVVYAYQSGIEPISLEHEPGRLITIATLEARRRRRPPGFRLPARRRIVQSPLAGSTTAHLRRADRG